MPRKPQVRSKDDEQLKQRITKWRFAFLLFLLEVEGEGFNLLSRAVTGGREKLSDWRCRDLSG